LIEAAVLALGLAMDATAVSAARGLAGHGRHEMALLPLLFGGFQSGMAALGWLAGRWAGDYIARWQHWVAFALLVLIGGKMLLDAWRDDPDPDAGERRPATRTAVYVGLALATSIDAAAAGITLPLVPTDPWLAVVLIGAITAACSALGFVGGRALGRKIGGKLALLGGVALIAIGIQILIRGL
jgi:putative Mn2+ efflux pump MntP